MPSPVLESFVHLEERSSILTTRPVGRIARPILVLQGIINHLCGHRNVTNGPHARRIFPRKFTSFKFQVVS
jgi:hypothetical protein